MRDLTTRERAAIEAVARQFSTTPASGDDSADAYLKIAGKRVAVDITALKQRGAGQGHAANPRLRSDKVATRLIEGLQSTLREIVPDGTTVVLTITAPIRLPAKTAAALEDKIPTLLGRGSASRDWKDTIHGNRVQIRLFRNGSDRSPKMIGFVHNPDSDPLLLLNMTRDFLELVSGEADRRATKRADDRFLVVITAGGFSFLEAYRSVYSQLRAATDFKKVLMVFGDGRVGMLG